MTRAALLGAALVLSSVASAVAAAGTPAAPAEITGTLAGGGRYIVRPTAGAPVAAIALWYRASSSGFGAPQPGIGRLAASAVAASPPITGTSLEAFITQLGGRLSVTAYPESVAISILVPADRASAAVQAVTRSYFAPVLTDTGLDIARRDEQQDAAIRHLSPDTAITDQLYGRLFTAGPAKSPPYPTIADLAAMSIETVRSYAERAFRPANAILVVAGAVDPAIVTAALTGREGAAAGTEIALPEAVASPVPAPLATVGSETGFGLAWAGPPIADEREATAMDFIADYLFYPDSGTVQRAAQSTGAGLSGTFVTYHDPGVFLITATGGDTATARRLVDAALLAIRQPLDPAAFAAARQQFVYHILSDAATPQALADTFGWYAVEGNEAYAPAGDVASGRYFAAADSLTPAFVAATAAKYLARPGVAITVATPPGQAR